jgi:hypothetical protein
MLYIFTLPTTSLYTKQHLPLTTFNNQRKKLLYIFVSIGTNEKRNEIIKNNINHIIIKNQHHPRYQFDCILYTYSAQQSYPNWVQELVRSKNPVCDVIKVYNGRYIGFLKSVPPLLVEQVYNYVTFVLDDVAHYPPFGTVDIVKYFDILFENNLGF